MELKRTFHAVGQGAFYTERFYEGNKNVFNVVYDCGSETSKKKKKSIDNAIERFCKDHKDHVEADNTSKPKIDLVFVSHFHDDHVNGMSMLLEKCDVEKLVIPFMSLESIIEVYIYNIIASNNVNNAANRFLVYCFWGSNDRVTKIPSREGEALVYSSGDVIKPNGLSGLENLWEYIPICITDNRKSSFILGFQANYKDLYDAFKNNDYYFVNAFFSSTIEIERMRGFYKGYFKDLNESSMAVLSKPATDLGQRNALCLYTGDYPMRSKRSGKKLIDYYRVYWNETGTIQVPHHGASNDNPLYLYEGVERECVMCYGKGNRYRHPGKTTIYNIKHSGSILKEVTQDFQTEYKQLFAF